ncbi:MAG TPA: aldehyde dehydrogenase family protein [Actinomycetota bacterium]|nr:aldehyde dehydrogenase family protein [Actinomycetota bacterium]
MRANYIGGEWLEGSTTVDDVNPSDLSDVVDEFAVADEAQVDTAIDAAVAAAPEWAASTPAERFTVLERVGLELEARSRELGEQLSREEGKPRAEGVGEVLRAAQLFRFFAGEALRIPGEHMRSVRPGVDVDVLREPLGVVGVITPWNFPIAIPAWKIAPALAYGCTVVFKPAELVPASAWSMVEICARAGLPPGVLNLVVGPGRVVGERLLHDPRVRGVTFTGSQAIGSRVAQALAARFGKAQLEMGGKNPLVILDDADLDIAVDCALQGAFFQTGQRCTASSRLIATQGIHDRFVDALVERLRSLRVGHALGDDTDIGPVVSADQLEQDLGYLALGRDEGAELVQGGARLERETDGYFLEPALFVSTANEMRVNREEIFGPIATVIRAGDADEALALANDTEYGLSAGVCTTSLAQAVRFRDGLQAGIVTVNLPTAGVDFHVPFGGTKGSSSGSREQGRYAVEFFTTVKTAYVRP